MLYNIIKSIRNKINNKRYVKKLWKLKVQLCLPFTISNIENISLGQYIYIGPESWLVTRGKLFIGDGTIIGPRIKIHTSNHNYDSGELLPYNSEYLIRDVIIGKFVWVGADVTIMPGVIIGDGAVLAANSCIVKDVPECAVVGGNPAKILKYRDISKYNRCFEKNLIYLEKKWNGEIKQ